MTKKRKSRCLCTGVVFVLSLFCSWMASSFSAGAASGYPNEILLGAFWESDEDNTDTLYWSTDGINFYELAEAYVDSTPNSAESAWLPNTPYNVSTLHDPSLIYKDGYFWMLSGYASSTASGMRYIPMIGYSKDLTHWSYPNSGSSSNVSVKGTPPGQNKYGNNWDAVAPDFMVDDDGTVWITVCLGYYAQFHGDKSENDTLQPYLIKASGLSVPANGDPVSNPGAPPVVTYSEAVPINLPSYTNVNIDNRIDSSLYKDGGYYYLSVKKDGVTNEIWRTKNLSLDSCQNPSNWELVCDDAVTGFEGPCLTKYKGNYYLYTDKLADYPPDEHDGLRGVHVSVASIATTGRLDQYTGFLEENQHRITGWGADGSKKECRHGTVITVTDPNAIKVIWDLKATTRYAGRSGDPAAPVQMGWYKKESYRAPRYGSQFVQYWYEGGVRQGLVNRGKEIYDPGTNAWYWLDSDNMGAMAQDKDVYLPVFKDEYNMNPNGYSMDKSNWKWVRYDYEGKMIYGEDHRHIPGTADNAEWGFWYFDKVTGAMQYGLQEIPTNGGGTKWVYYDDVTGVMLYGYHDINGSLYYFDQYDGTAIDGWYPDAGTGILYWYEKGERQGYHTDDPAYRGKEIYDPGTGQWYWLDNVQQGAVAKDKWVFQESQADDAGNVGKWVRYNEYGCMIKGWWVDPQTNASYYFDLTYGTSYRGYHEFPNGEVWTFDDVTGVGTRLR